MADLDAKLDLIKDLLEQAIRESKQGVDASKGR
jgi:hypothetical protein